MSLSARDASNRTTKTPIHRIKRKPPPNIDMELLRTIEDNHLLSPGFASSSSASTPSSSRTISSTSSMSKSLPSISLSRPSFVAHLVGDDVTEDEYDDDDDDNWNWSPRIVDIDKENGAPFGQNESYFKSDVWRDLGNFGGAIPGEDALSHVHEDITSGLKSVDDIRKITRSISSRFLRPRDLTPGSPALTSDSLVAPSSPPPQHARSRTPEPIYRTLHNPFTGL